MNTGQQLIRTTDGCLFVDNSGLTNFMTCPRQGYYNQIVKRKLKKSRIALDFGKAIHAALEVRYRNPSKVVTTDMEAEQVETLAKQFREVVIDTGEYRTLDYAIETIQRYNSTYPVDLFTPITMADGKPAVEIPFALPIGTVSFPEGITVINNGSVATLTEIHIIFTGKIDLIVNKEHMLLLVDHKTASIGGAGFFEEFYTSFQFKGYRWAAEQILGKRVAGVVINALIVRKPTKAGWSGEFLRDTIYYHEEHIEEWRVSIQHTISDFLHCYQRDYFPLHTAWCKGKYGLCDYYSVCQLPPSSRENMINSGLFVPNDWSPLASESKTTQMDLP